MNGGLSIPAGQRTIHHDMEYVNWFVWHKWVEQ
jgi:hypothetical protein